MALQRALQIGSKFSVDFSRRFGDSSWNNRRVRSNAFEGPVRAGRCLVRVFDAGSQTCVVHRFDQMYHVCGCPFGADNLCMNKRFFLLASVPVRHEQCRVRFFEYVVGYWSLQILLNFS